MGKETGGDSCRMCMVVSQQAWCSGRHYLSLTDHSDAEKGVGRVGRYSLKSIFGREKCVQGCAIKHEVL